MTKKKESGQKTMSIINHKHNDLATTCPKLLAEWDYSKNVDMDPNIITYASNKKAWWKCPEGHEWQAIISNRTTKGQNCPYCAGQRVVSGINDLGTINPTLASEWHPNRNNGLFPTDVSSNSHKKVWWVCQYGHEWQAVIANRNKGAGCPICSNRTVVSGINDLATINPSLVREWNYKKNNISPDRISSKSSKTIWWICPEGHEWLSSVYARSNGASCPECKQKEKPPIQKRIQYPQPNSPQSLMEANPDLANEWNYHRNLSLTPQDIAEKSSKKVWWICKYGHEWEATPYNRSKGGRCPFCSGRRVYTGFNDLATINPSLALEWHPSKNGEISPSMVSYKSQRLYWWQCSNGHEWQARVYDRSRRGYGCPYCSPRHLQPGINDLATVNPTLSDEWDYENNQGLTPKDVMPNSNKKVWWKCIKGHHWQAVIASRNAGRGCPICDEGRKTSFPEQALFYYTKMFFPDSISRDNSSGKEIDVYIPSLKTGIEYDGERWHKSIDKDIKKRKWFEAKKIRIINIREKNCPILPFETDIIIREDNSEEALDTAIEKLLSLLGISSACISSKADNLLIQSQYNQYEREHSLITLYPELASEWHPTKNVKITPSMVPVGSIKKHWWICSKGHEWQASIPHRVKGSGCPYCYGRYLIIGENDLSTINPELAAEWHPTKNGELTPDKVMSSVSTVVWWMCTKGHEWQASINNRSRGEKCPICSNHKLLPGYNDFATRDPALAQEWHPTKNGDLSPNMFFPYNKTVVWWKCGCGYEWQASISDRFQGRKRCPICNPKR